MEDRISALEAKVEKLARGKFQLEQALNRLVQEWVPKVNACLQDLASRVQALETAPKATSDEGAVALPAKNKPRKFRAPRQPRNLHDYERVMKLFKDGMSLNRIHIILRIPYSTVYSYTLMEADDIALLRERARLDETYKELAASPEFAANNI
jgi:exonuclease VII small subunit